MIKKSCVFSVIKKYKEKEENCHTGLIDEADGMEYDNAPAKANKDLSTEVGPKQNYPYTGIMLCMPCRTNDGESISSISTSEKTSKIGEVDSLVNEILQSPERAIKTMQEALNHPKVAHLLQDNTSSKRMPKKAEKLHITKLCQP